LIEFKAWPKIPRLNRDITITEKIDGTNGAIGITELGSWLVKPGTSLDDGTFATVLHSENGYEITAYGVYAQSRSRIITPAQDNHGFAAWVWDNAARLFDALGPGLHYGEWWGNGIQRGYGLPRGEKRFSLFNTKRWADIDSEVPGLSVVPTLYEGAFDYPSGVGTFAWSMRPWERALDDLQVNGSQAVPGFMNPEGIVIYHHAANAMFKVTLEGDDAPKAAIRLGPSRQRMRLAA
jgi:hypothetical protein